MNPKCPICKVCGGVNDKPRAPYCSYTCQNRYFSKKQSDRQANIKMMFYKTQNKQEVKVDRLLDMCSYSSPQAIKELISLF